MKYIYVNIEFGIDLRGKYSYHNFLCLIDYSWNFRWLTD